MGNSYGGCCGNGRNPMAIKAIFGGNAIPPQPSQVVFDAVSSAEAINSTSLTYSHTCTGTNRFLIVGVQYRIVFNTPTVTYAGITMTLISEQIASGEGDVIVGLFKLIAPSTGVNNVLVTFPAVDYVSSGSISFTNVNQNTPVGSVFKATTDSVNVTGTTSTSLVVDTILFENAVSNVAGASQTERYDIAGFGAGSTEPGNGGNVTMSWTGGSGAAAIIAIEVKVV